MKNKPKMIPKTSHFFVFCLILELTLSSLTSKMCPAAPKLRFGTDLVPFRDHFRTFWDPDSVNFSTIGKVP